MICQFTPFLFKHLFFRPAEIRSRERAAAGAADGLSAEIAKEKKALQAVKEKLRQLEEGLTKQKDALDDEAKPELAALQAKLTAITATLTALEEQLTAAQATAKPRPGPSMTYVAAAATASTPGQAPQPPIINITPQIIKPHVTLGLNEIRCVALVYLIIKAALCVNFLFCLSFLLGSRILRPRQSHQAQYNILMFWTLKWLMLTANHCQWPFICAK